jgi:hypothetical protein
MKKNGETDENWQIARVIILTIMICSGTWDDR